MSKFEPHSKSALWACFATGFILVCGLIAYNNLRADGLICNPRPPDYLGCSSSQIHQIEGPDHPTTHQHYRENRWGQSSNPWHGNLGAKAEDKLQTGYNRAVNRYLAKHKMKASALPYPTWGAFRAASACTGGFGGIPLGWCWLNKDENDAIAAVEDPAVHETLVCGGYAVTGAVSGTVIDKFLVTAISPERVGAYAAGGAAACVTEQMFTIIRTFW